MTLGESKKIVLHCEIDIPKTEELKFHNTDVLARARNLSALESADGVAFATTQIAALDFAQIKLHNNDDLAANKKLAESNPADEGAFNATQKAVENFDIATALLPL